MATGQKKVIVRLAGGSLAWGYLAQGNFVVPPIPPGTDCVVDLIEVDARVKSLLFNDIQAISYVKDFNLGDLTDPERMGRRAFAIRPKGEGLWVRLELCEMAPLEGLIHLDLGFLDSAIEDRGVMLTPPDGRSNVLRIFVPRHAIRNLEVVAWLSSPSRRLAEKTARRMELALQAGLFDDRP